MRNISCKATRKTTRNEQRTELHSWLDTISTIVLDLRDRGQLTESGQRELDATIEQARDGLCDVLDGRRSI